MTHDTREVEEFATQLSKSVRYSSGRGQYDAFPDCQDAYLDGVETAIAMMYIDLTGSPKSEGMLAKFLHHQLQKARQDWLREEIVKLERMKEKQQVVSVYKNFRDDIYGYNLALQTIIDRYQAELDQDVSK